MSITQSYYLAHKARSKLSREAARSDHNLRLLVGHANLLDSLMLDLAEAEREQEFWFNQSVCGASNRKTVQHIQWADTVVEAEHHWESEDTSSDDSDSCSDSDSDISSEDDYDAEIDIEMADAMPLHRVASHSSNTHFTTHKSTPLDSTDLDLAKVCEEAVEFEDDYEEEDYAGLALKRLPSHSHSPPELDEDNDSSEDETTPLSPPNPPVHELNEKEREALVTTSYYNAKSNDDNSSSFYEEGYYLSRQANPASLVSSISVF